MRLLIIWICVMTITLGVSCSFFRKKSTLTYAVEVRDSVGFLDSLSQTYHFDIRNSENKKISLSAKGFQKIHIDSNGNILAEGENGQLDLLKNDGKNNNSSGSLKNKEVHSHTAVQDSSNLSVDKKYEYKAKPDAWSITWVSVVIAVIILGGFVILLNRIYGKSKN